MPEPISLQKPSARPGTPAEFRRICELTGKTARLDLRRKPGPQLAALIQSIFSLESVAVFDADLRETHCAGEEYPALAEMVRNTYLFETISEEPATRLSRRVLRVGRLPVGALLLRGDISPQASSAIAALAAITFDRYHALANESRTEAARRAEQMRTTVLDSLAHAYKSPLTAIRAAGTGLVELGGLTSTQAELIELINEQADYLSQLTTRLLKTARLDDRDLQLRLENVRVISVIEEVLARVRDRLPGLAVRIQVRDNTLALLCDRELVASLLLEYLDNAGKYAEAGSSVTISASQRGGRRKGEIVFSVNTRGPVIPARDHERIFDRYFRSASHSGKAPGTGIGLSIAKQVAQAHGGRVWVTSDALRGTTFFAAFPQRLDKAAGA